MNQLLAAQFQAVDRALDELERAVGDLKTRLEEQRENRDALQQACWQRDKEIAVLKRAAADYARLEARIDTLESREDAVRARLHKVLGYTKALNESLRP